LRFKNQTQPKLVCPRSYDPRAPFPSPSRSLSDFPTFPFCKFFYNVKTMSPYNPPLDCSFCPHGQNLTRQNSEQLPPPQGDPIFFLSSPGKFLPFFQRQLSRRIPPKVGHKCQSLILSYPRPPPPFLARYSFAGGIVLSHSFNEDVFSPPPPFAPCWHRHMTPLQLLNTIPPPPFLFRCLFLPS